MAALIRSRLQPLLLNNTRIIRPLKRGLKLDSKTRKKYGFMEPREIDWDRVDRRRIILGTFFTVTIVGVYCYTFYAVQQEDFLDVPPLPLEEKSDQTAPS